MFPHLSRNRARTKVRTCPYNKDCAEYQLGYKDHLSLSGSVLFSFEFLIIMSCIHQQE